MNDSIYKHIYTEFRFGNVFSIDKWTLLSEEDGLTRGTEAYEAIVFDFLSKHEIGPIKQEITMGSEWFANMENSPFKTMTVNMLVSVNPKQVSYHRGYYNSKSEITHPTFRIEANADTVYNLALEVCKTLYHEAIHAMERDSLKTSQGKEIFNLKQGNNYYNYINQVLNGAQNALAERLFKFLYWTDFGERKAFVGTLYGELKAHANEITDSKTGYKVLVNTDAWKGFQKWAAMVDELNRGKNSLPYTRQMLSIFNNVCNPKIKNYQTLLKMVNRRWRKMKEAVERKAARLIYRVYKESGGCPFEIYPGVY